MNKVIDEVNSIDSKAFEYTDREIIKLHNEINNQLSELENLLQSQIDVNSLDINDLKGRATHLENEVVRLENRIDSLKDYVDDNVDRLRNEINTVYHTLIALMTELKNYVEELIKKMTVKVYSNYDGCKKDIKEAINDIYNYNKRRYSNSEVSFGFIKSLLDVQYNVSLSGDNYDAIKNVLTFSELKSIAVKTNLSNVFIPMNTNPNPVSTSENDWLTVNYYTSNLFKYFKFDFMIYLYVYICTSSFDYNRTGDTNNCKILCDRIASAMRSYIGSFNYKGIPYNWFGWSVYY